MPVWWAGMGTQALVILVSHLASPQYVLLLFSAIESVCEGKLCYEAREGNAVAFCVVSAYTADCSHNSPQSPEQNTIRDVYCGKNFFNGIGNFRVMVTLISKFK